MSFFYRFNPDFYRDTMQHFHMFGISLSSLRRFLEKSTLQLKDEYTLIVTHQVLRITECQVLRYQIENSMDTMSSSFLLSLQDFKSQLKSSIEVKLHEIIYMISIIEKMHLSKSGSLELTDHGKELNQTLGEIVSDLSNSKQLLMINIHLLKVKAIPQIRNSFSEVKIKESFKLNCQCLQEFLGEVYTSRCHWCTDSGSFYENQNKRTQQFLNKVTSNIESLFWLTQNVFDEHDRYIYQVQTEERVTKNFTYQQVLERHVQGMLEDIESLQGEVGAAISLLTDLKGQVLIQVCQLETKRLMETYGSIHNQVVHMLEEARHHVLNIEQRWLRNLELYFDGNISLAAVGENINFVG